VTAGGAGPAGGGGDARVVLIGKPGCHLCETARDVVSAVAADLGVEWREVSILDEPELAERYAEQIPVVIVDGREHDYWRVDERRLRQALGRRRWWRRG
jgi:glutaredoxin